MVGSRGGVVDSAPPDGGRMTVSPPELLPDDAVPPSLFALDPLPPEKPGVAEEEVLELEELLEPPPLLGPSPPSPGSAGWLTTGPVAVLGSIAVPSPLALSSVIISSLAVPGWISTFFISVSPLVAPFTQSHPPSASAAMVRPEAMMRRAAV